MYDQPSRSLRTRLENIERRLRTLNTVTNTASAEISGGETVIDDDGSIYFLDGGRLVLGSSSILSTDLTPILDKEGNLSVDSLQISGDILSASDYLAQREAISDVILDTNVVRSVNEELEIGFPDWASSALVTYYIQLHTRISSPDANKILIRINGKPVGRPKSDSLGNVYLNSSVVRRVQPEQPVARFDISIDDDVVPVVDPIMKITVGGVFSA